jgi:hypothetical protein
MRKTEAKKTVKRRKYGRHVNVGAIGIDFDPPRLRLNTTVAATLFVRLKIATRRYETAIDNLIAKL